VCCRAHRDAAARLGVRKRIVEQIRDQLAQQERFTQSPCILELEAEIDVFPEGTLHQSRRSRLMISCKLTGWPLAASPVPRAPKSTAG